MIKNIAFLVALAAIYPVLIARLSRRLLSQKIFLGLMFGLVGMLGMMTPIDYGSGVIFDGRSIILAVAGIIGGPLVAGISVLIMAAYRAWLGGGGVPVGLSVIIVSAAIGVGFHYLRKRNNNFLSVLPLLGFGFLVHVVMLVLFLFLPNSIGMKVFADLGAIILLLYPLATMLISLLFQDYEERERSRLHIEHLAYFDTLTQLPNRSRLIDKLNYSISVCSRCEDTGALVLLNLDRFKTLNEVRGHTAGDILLRTVAERLLSVIGDDDVLARMSADEFAILLQQSADNNTPIDTVAQRMVHKVQVALMSPLHVDAEEITVSSSIGMTTFPINAADTAGDVLRRVDTAMHRAKKGGGNRSIVFDSSMSKLVEQRFLIERELRQAIRNNDLRLYVQSQVSGDGVLVGAETLVRWQHPERGLIPPIAFIPIAEESELIVELGQWVLSQACQLLASATLKSAAIGLSVNISARQLRHIGFSDFVKATLTQTGADPKRLTLEVTESLLIENMNDIIDKMLDLTQLGIRFSLDDFGTGYSSLAYLKRLPIQELKIDKSFVQDACTDPNDAALVESILAVAKHMGLVVVAEGVETQQQADFLNACGRVIQQGYLFGKPEPWDCWLEKIAVCSVTEN